MNKLIINEQITTFGDWKKANFEDKLRDAKYSFTYGMYSYSWVVFRNLFKGENN